ncbi:MAG: four helix bundle protein [Candidatus Omnitrophica bacterium]|nr:four helix bundle protein [Candidatus Omnitrophota bacterium]
MKSFKQLKIWQKGIEIVKDVYVITKKFPKEELYGLTSQMRRAAISLPSNIAEGFKRFHNKEYIQFLYIALGSAAELETQLIIAKEVGFIDKEKVEYVSEKLDHFSKMTSSLLTKLK